MNYSLISNKAGTGIIGIEIELTSVHGETGRKANIEVINATEALKSLESVLADALALGNLTPEQISQIQPNTIQAVALGAVATAQKQLRSVTVKRIGAQSLMLALQGVGPNAVYITNSLRRDLRNRLKFDEIIIDG